MSDRDDNELAAIREQAARHMAALVERNEVPPLPRESADAIARLIPAAWEEVATSELPSTSQRSDRLTHQRPPRKRRVRAPPLLDRGHRRAGVFVLGK